MSTPAETRPAALRLYSHWQVFVAALIGSVLAGGLLLAINYRRLGQQRNVVTALGLGAVGLAVCIGLGALADRMTPSHASSTIPFLSALVCDGFAKQVQGEAYRANLKNGGVRESWWRTLGWALVCMLAFLGVVLVLVVVTGAYPQ